MLTWSIFSFYVTYKNNCGSVNYSTVVKSISFYSITIMKKLYHKTYTLIKQYAYSYREINTI